MSQFGVWHLESESWLTRVIADDGSTGVVQDTHARCTRLAAQLNGRHAPEYEVRPIPMMDRATISAGCGLA